MTRSRSRFVLAALVASSFVLVPVVSSCKPADPDAVKGSSDSSKDKDKDKDGKKKKPKKDKEAKKEDKPVTRNEADGDLDPDAPQDTTPPKPLTIDDQRLLTDLKAENAELKRRLAEGGHPDRIMGIINAHEHLYH
ncbi:MAG TPA: hypothetical protein VGO62_19520, partial [Myxococcota bacterium]